MKPSRTPVLLLAALGLASCEVASPASPAPAPLRQGWWAVVAPRIAQGDAGFSWVDGAPRATLPLGFTARLDGQGATLVDEDGAVSLGAARWGRDGEMWAAEAGMPEAGACLGTGEVQPSGACVRRMEQDRGGGLVEWWASRTTGLEQGWDIDAPPPGDGPLLIDVAVGGAAVELDEDGLGAWFTGDAGQIYRYADLVAWDADGAPLDAVLEALPGGLRVVVEDEGATYPITVDPVVTTATTTITGTSSGIDFGIAVSGAGDVNNDGYDDIIVGAPSYSGGRGAVFIYHGSSAGLSTTAARTLSVSTTGAYLGFAVAGAGDVNNDGYDDIIAGAFGMSSYLGAAYVAHGSSSGIASSSSTTLTGVSSAGEFGIAVDGAGDVNNDGYDDVIVGADYVSTGTGAAYIYHGSSSGISSTVRRTLTGTTSSYFGYVVAGAGDTDGDGYDDVIVGAYGVSSYKGGAYVFEGSSSGIGSAASASLSGPSSSAYFGVAVNAAGDVNNDGYDDVIVGASGVTSGTGAAYVYHGRSSTLSTSATSTLTGRSTSGYFGIAVSGIGDADGDGYDDVIVGAYGVSASTGAAYAYTGSSSGVSTTAGATLSGSSSGGEFGIAVSGAGDVNGDGYGDAIVGADQASGTYGAVYLFVGQPQDNDGDGYTADEDCDDTDRTINPGATEVTGDGVDQNCDDRETCYADADGDRYRTTSTVPSSDTDCTDSGEASTSTTNGDCDDTDATVNPGATEVTGDGVDQDCNDRETCYVDADDDGYRMSTTVVSTDEDCGDTGEATSADDTGDCDDADATVHPGATEGVGDSVDQDCDDHEDCYADLDGDGYHSDDTIASADLDCEDSKEAGARDPGDDCDDRDETVYPGADEVPLDGVDQDCNGSDGYDGDGDGHDAESSGGDDCDDSDDGVFPGADEQAYDGVDQDCDGQDLNDVDEDGSAAEAAGGDDCDDEDAEIHPGAEELDDGVDNDCDGFSEDDDPDGDGLSTQDEEDAGTDPDQADTDGDGVSDGDELEAGTDPLVDDAPGEGEGEGEGEIGEGEGEPDAPTHGSCSFGLEKYGALFFGALALGWSRRRRLG